MQVPVLLSSTQPSLSATRYLPFAAGFGLGTTWESSSAQARTPMPVAGKISKFRVQLTGNTDNGGVVFTLQKNAVDTSVVLTIAGGASVASDLVTEITFNQGDTLRWKCVPNIASNPTVIGAPRLAMMIEPTPTGTGVVFAGMQAGTASNVTAPGTRRAQSTTSEQVVAVPMPTGGQFDYMSVFISAATTAGATRTFTVRKSTDNGANFTDTALTVTISNGDTLPKVIDLTGSGVSFAQGDLITIKQTCSTSPAPASADACISLRWLPTTDGESLLFSSTPSGLSTSASRELLVSGLADNTQATSQNSLASVAFTLKNLTVWQSAANENGVSTQSRSYTVRNGAVNQSLTVTLSEATVAANDNTAGHAVAVADNDQIDIITTPSGTPAAANIGIGLVAYIAPTTTSVRSQGAMLSMVG